MKKIIVIILSIIILLAVIIGGIYCIDMNRMQNNKPIFFSTWGHDYTNPIAEKITDVKIGTLRSTVITKFGEPDAGLFGMFGDIYNIEDKQVIIYYEQKDDKATVVEVKVIDKNEPSKEATQSFIGTVLEETTTYMIVEPNEDENEKKSSDKIRINYGVDHNDYLYGIGRKVLITYSGYIMETYPAQINTNDIKTEGYTDFAISVVKSDDTYDKEFKTLKKKILNNKDIYEMNTDYDLYYYGLDEVNIAIGEETLPLEEALMSGKITLEGIIAKANNDVKVTEEKYSKYEESQSVPQLFPYTNIYRDGGSIEYHYEGYTILKMHSLDGDRNVYIGTADMNINQITK